MDVAALSIALSTSQLMTDVSMALMKNAKEMVTDQGAGVMELLESAAAPVSMGSTFDISI